MGLSASLLAEGERALLVLHPHVRRLVRPALILLVLSPVASFLAASVPPGGAQPALRLAVVAVALAVAARFVVWPFVVWWSTIYVLTDERILERHGVVRRLGHDLPLQGVSDVFVAQRVADRLFRSGTLIVRTEGGAEFTARDVPAVNLLQRTLVVVVDDVAERIAAPQRLAHAELGEADHDDDLRGHDPDVDYGGDYESDEGEGEHGYAYGDEPDALDAREARRREKEHRRRLRRLAAEVRRAAREERGEPRNGEDDEAGGAVYEPAAAPGEPAFESLLDAAPVPVRRDGRQTEPPSEEGGDEPPEGARILRFPRRP